MVTLEVVRVVIWYCLHVYLNASLLVKLPRHPLVHYMYWIAQAALEAMKSGIGNTSIDYQ